MSAPSPHLADPQRRQVLIGLGLGALSGLAVTWGWWQNQAPPSDGPTAVWWEQSFQTVDGTTLALDSLRGKPLLLNFWATWCPPCIAEMPLLNRFYQDHVAQDWQVLGLAIDQPHAVQAFLERHPVQFPVVLASPGGSDLARTLGNLNGALPFSVLVGVNGQILQRKMGQLTPEILETWRNTR